MSTPTTALRVGSIWRKGARSAIAIQVEPESYMVLLRSVIDGRPGRRYWVSTSGSVPRGYAYVGQQPALTCLDEAAAEAAVALLRSKGVADHCAFACGRIVVVSMTPGSIMKFADDALGHGWAHDEDCARMMGDLG